MVEDLAKFTHFYVQDMRMIYFSVTLGFGISYLSVIMKMMLEYHVIITVVKLAT